tara:strand:+ start:3473 stop:3730 length:258 start_codon:yes stop_codon:yes gene_type:complete
MVLPSMAHFVNNGLTYLYQGKLDEHRGVQRQFVRFLILNTEPAFTGVMSENVLSPGYDNEAVLYGSAKKGIVIMVEYILKKTIEF